jgi:N-acetylglucosamine kinase-like BadF-type ATPase
MSKYGLLLEAEREIALGVVVFIGTGAVLYGRGCVRHCTPSGGEKYLIGLNTPDHMTALMVSVDSDLA